MTPAEPCAVRRVWFHDTPVAFELVEPRHAGLVDPLIGDLRPSTDVTPRFTIRIATHPDLHRPPPGLTVHEGELTPGLPWRARMAETGPREWMLVDGHASVLADTGTSIAEVRLRPDANSGVAASAAIFAMETALAASEQHLLHGAALVSPAGSAILIFAPSGVGKTTTSLALALNGYALLTDDALVLTFEQGQPHVWGLPRPMKVHHNTAAMLPALSSLVGPEWNGDGEQVVTLRSFRSVGAIGAQRGWTIGHIYLLGQRSPGEHAIAPASKADVLLALANDNLGASQFGVMPRHVRKMEALARLLSAVPASHLRVGAPLQSVGEAMARAGG
jgi:hypothetical protein